MIHDKALARAQAEVRAAFPAASKVTCCEMKVGGLFITVGFMRGGGLVRYGAAARDWPSVRDAIRSVRGRAIGDGIKIG
jgi:hypothetical protein